MSPKTTRSKEENHKLAQEIYDLLMADIEPELLLEVIPTLDTKYKGESKDEHEERMERYQDAYAKFDEESAGFMQRVHENAKRTRHDAMQAEENADRAEEQSELNSIEAAFG